VTFLHLQLQVAASWEMEFCVYHAKSGPPYLCIGFFCLENLCSGKKISAASIYFQSLPFKVHPETGLIDYEKLEETVLLFRPKILICGGSSYPREWDYGRFRQIANKVNAILMCDMAHISGLVAAEVRIPNPTCVVGPCIPSVDSLLVGL
jgi:glycine/serine hydroxymethyltransferase